MDKLPYQPSRPAATLLHPLSELYKPLARGYIRLLLILDFNADGIVTCSLDPVALEDAERTYTAISYTWDEQERRWYGKHNTLPKVIIINGNHVIVPDKVANIIAMMERSQLTQNLDRYVVYQSVGS